MLRRLAFGKTAIRSRTASVEGEEVGMIVVVGGSGTKVGKTALVCGIVAALSELAWTAVKITSHNYGPPGPIWEEMEPGQGTDTARYLAAGARRALLISAPPPDLGALVEPLLQSCRESFRSGLIFESNRILDYLDPDVCLAVEGESSDDPKPSFGAIQRRADALVLAGAREESAWDAKPVFRLAAEQISPAMAGWLRLRVASVDARRPDNDPEDARVR